VVRLSPAKSIAAPKTAWPSRSPELDCEPDHGSPWPVATLEAPRWRSSTSPAMKRGRWAKSRGAISTSGAARQATVLVKGAADDLQIPAARQSSEESGGPETTGNSGSQVRRHGEDVRADIRDRISLSRHWRTLADGAVGVRMQFAPRNAVTKSRAIRLRNRCPSNNRRRNSREST